MKNNLKELLNNTLESYYWIGFLLADGNFRFDTKSCRLRVSILDIDHIEKYKTFLKLDNIDVETWFNNGFEYCGLSLADCNTVPLLCNKFDIHENKTVTPPSLKVYKGLSREKLLSLIVGYIDGDGCIQYQTNRKDCALRIKLHKNWLNFLFLIRDALEKETNVKNPDPFINKKGYSVLTFSNIRHLRFLKNFIVTQQLPVLNRKWNKIDEFKISKYELKYLIAFLSTRGYSRNEIGQILNLKSRTVDQWVCKFRKNKIKEDALKNKEVIYETLLSKLI